MRWGLPHSLSSGASWGPLQPQTQRAPKSLRPSSGVGHAGSEVYGWGPGARFLMPAVRPAAAAAGPASQSDRLCPCPRSGVGSGVRPPGGVLQPRPVLHGGLPGVRGGAGVPGVCQEERGVRQETVRRRPLRCQNGAGTSGNLPTCGNPWCVSGGRTRQPLGPPAWAAVVRCDSRCPPNAEWEADLPPH